MAPVYRLLEKGMISWSDLSHLYYSDILRMNAYLTHGEAMKYAYSQYHDEKMRKEMDSIKDKR